MQSVALVVCAARHHAILATGGRRERGSALAVCAGRRRRREHRRVAERPRPHDVAEVVLLLHVVPLALIEHHVEILVSDRIALPIDREQIEVHRLARRANVIDGAMPM
jgi:hypothetical protein